MKQRIIATALFVLCALFSNYARADYTNVVVASCGNETLTTGTGYVLSQDATGKLCVNATVSASVSGFTPGGTFATLTAAGTSGSVALPAGTTVAFQNTGTTAVSCTLGVGSATAVASEIIVQAASTVFVTPGSNTWGACIDQTGSTSNTVVLAGGSGLGTGFGGGGGGGSGGSVTQGTTPWTDQGAGASGAALAGNPFRVGLSDGTNNQNWLAAIALADGVNGNNTGAMAQWYWNGATYDRARGDLTNGGWVNVKTSVLPTGAATAALQATNSATTAHTCSTAGFSELGCLGQIDDDIKGPIASQSPAVPIGGVGICDGANGATNPCTNPVTVKAASTAAAAADKAMVVAISPNGLASTSSAAINVSTATTTQLVALSGSTKIYVTSFDVIAGGTGNITFEYGTGASCGTGTTVLTGAYNLTAQAGISKGSGTGAVLVVPAGNALCVLTSAAVQMSGSISYQQF